MKEMNVDRLMFSADILDQKNLHKAFEYYEDNEVIGIAFNNDYLGEANRHILHQINRVYMNNFRLTNDLRNPFGKESNFIWPCNMQNGEDREMYRNYKYIFFYAKKKDLEDAVANLEDYSIDDESLQQVENNRRLVLNPKVIRDVLKLNEIDKIKEILSQSLREFDEISKIVQGKNRDSITEASNDDTLVNKYTTAFFATLADALVEQNPYISKNGEALIFNCNDFVRYENYLKNGMEDTKPITLWITREPNYDSELSDNPYISSLIASDINELEITEGRIRKDVSFDPTKCLESLDNKLGKRINLV